MRSYREKRQNRAMLYSWPVVIVLFVMAVFLGHSVYNVYKSEQAASIKEKAALSERDEALARKKELLAEVDQLQTPRGVEEEIRTKFPVAKPGEQVVVVVDEKATTTVTKEKSSWWTRLWQNFGL
jgi:hypothetical protein